MVLMWGRESMTHFVEHVNRAIVAAGLGIQPGGNGFLNRNLEIAELCVRIAYPERRSIWGCRVTGRCDVFRSTGRDLVCFQGCISFRNSSVLCKSPFTLLRM